MKALSIRQPWAWLIVAGYKDIENRTWPTSLRGRIHVHAAKKRDPVPFSRIRRLLPAGVIRPAAFDTGAVIGEVDIIDCVTQSSSPWFSGPYGFVLANARAYDKPVPWRGRLGFFDVQITQGEEGV